MWSLVEGLNHYLESGPGCPCGTGCHLSCAQRAGVSRIAASCAECCLPSLPWESIQPLRRELSSRLPKQPLWPWAADGGKQGLDKSSWSGLTFPSLPGFLGPTVGTQAGLGRLSTGSSSYLGRIELCGQMCSSRGQPRETQESWPQP